MEVSWKEFTLNLDSMLSPGRENPTMVPFSKHEILIFGGFGYSGNFGDGFIVNTSNRDSSGMRVERAFNQ